MVPKPLEDIISSHYPQKKEGNDDGNEHENEDLIYYGDHHVNDIIPRRSSRFLSDTDMDNGNAVMAQTQSQDEKESYIDTVTASTSRRERKMKRRRRRSWIDLQHQRQPMVSLKNGAGSCFQTGSDNTGNHYYCSDSFDRDCGVGECNEYKHACSKDAARARFSINSSISSDAFASIQQFLDERDKNYRRDSSLNTDYGDDTEHIEDQIDYGSSSSDRDNLSIGSSVKRQHGHEQLSVIKKTSHERNSVSEGTNEPITINVERTDEPITGTVDSSKHIVKNSNLSKLQIDDYDSGPENFYDSNEEETEENTSGNYDLYCEVQQKGNTSVCSQQRNQNNHLIIDEVYREISDNNPPPQLNSNCSSKNSPPERQERKQIHPPSVQHLKTNSYRPPMQQQSHSPEQDNDRRHYTTHEMIPMTLPSSKSPVIDHDKINMVLPHAKRSECRIKRIGPSSLSSTFTVANAGAVTISASTSTVSKKVMNMEEIKSSLVGSRPTHWGVNTNSAKKRKATFSLLSQSPRRALSSSVSSSSFHHSNSSKSNSLAKKLSTATATPTPTMSIMSSQSRKKGSLSNKMNGSRSTALSQFSISNSTLLQHEYKKGCDVGNMMLPSTQWNENVNLRDMNFTPAFLNSNRERELGGKSDTEKLTGDLKEKDDEGNFNTRDDRVPTVSSSATHEINVGNVMSQLQSSQAPARFMTPTSNHHCRINDSNTSIVTSGGNNKNKNNSSNNSPNCFTPSRKWSARKKKIDGPLIKLLRSTRAAVEGDWVRLQSGSYPFRDKQSKRTGRMMDFNDPRNRARSYMDVTILGREVAPFISYPLSSMSESKQVVSVLGFVHCVVYDDPKERRKQHGGDLEGKGVLVNKKLQFSRNLDLLTDGQTDDNNDKAGEERKVENVSKPAWICFFRETISDKRIGQGTQLRLYDAVVVHTLPFAADKLADKVSESTHVPQHYHGDQVDTCPVILCTRICEPYPKSLPPLPNVLSFYSQVNKS